MPAISYGPRITRDRCRTRHKIRRSSQGGPWAALSHKVLVSRFVPMRRNVLVELAELAHSRNQHRPMILRYAVCGDCGDCSVFHRTVAFDVQEVEPGLWRWNIFPGNRVIQGPAHFRTRELAVEACHGEINDGIERTRRQFRETGTIRP